MGAPENLTPLSARNDGKGWIHHAAVYQVFPLTFNHADAQGATVERAEYGNIKGITAKLDHIAALGVDAIWISPLFESGLKNGFGYNPTNHSKIHEKYGTWEDMAELIHEAHKRNLRIITDQVYNHTSTEHGWFEASHDPKHQDHEKYKDHYIWAPPIIGGTDDQTDPYNIRINGGDQWVKLYPLRDKKGEPVRNKHGRILYPPNNWLQVDARDPAPAWEYDHTRHECYLHSFHHSMPDLNINNEAVREELLKTSGKWLDFSKLTPEDGMTDAMRQEITRKYPDVVGVDGFRLDAVAMYGCDPRVNKSLEDMRAEAWQAKQKQEGHDYPLDECKEKIKEITDDFLKPENCTAMAQAIRGLSDKEQKHMALYLGLKDPQDQDESPLLQRLGEVLDNLRQGGLVTDKLQILEKHIRRDPGWFIRGHGIPPNLKLKEDKARLTDDFVRGDLNHYTRDGVTPDHSYGQAANKNRFGHDSARALLGEIAALAAREPERTLANGETYKVGVVGEVLYPGDTAQTVQNYVGAGLLDVGFNAVLGSDRRSEHMNGFNLWAVRGALQWGMKHSEGETGKGAQWILEGHDMAGVSQRWHLDKMLDTDEHAGADVVQKRMMLLNKMLTCLPGSICLFQGQELGITQPESKDAVRSGNDSLELLEGAGSDMDLRRASFFMPECFMRMPQGCVPASPEAQMSDEASPYGQLRKALAERKQDPVLRKPGYLTFAHHEHENEVLAFVRADPETGKSRLCAFNFSTQERVIHYPVGKKGETKELRLAPLASRVMPLMAPHIAIPQQQAATAHAGR